MIAELSRRSDAEKQAEQMRVSNEYQRAANINARRKSRDGVVVTPVELVDFQVRSALDAIEEMGRAPDDGVEWLDPFGGTGVYTARLLQISDLTPRRKQALAANCIVIEIDPAAAQVCSNNLANVYFEETGFRGAVRVICTDTFNIQPDTDLWSEEFTAITPITEDSP